MRNEIAALHAWTKIHRTHVADARAVIARALEKTPTWYVAFSGGKDSTCVYHLAAAASPVAVLNGDDEWLLPETEAYLRRCAATFPFFHRIRVSVEHAAWFTAWDQDAEAWTGKNVAGRYAQLQGWQGAFLGLRAEENSRRVFHLRTGGVLFHNQGRGLWQCSPLYNWTVWDIWAFIVSNGLDYNQAYDRLEEIGVPIERQRIGPLAVERVLGYGQLAILKRGWPDLFNRFVAVHPEARSYT